MQTALLFLFSIIPVIILLWYFERQDRGEKEPKNIKRKIFIQGIFITFVAIAIELVLDQVFQTATLPKLYGLLILAYVQAAFVEEGLKFWIVKTQVYKTKHFNEVMDGITYAIIASMGFAVVENILYVVPGGFAVAAIRAFVSVPGHALFSGIMGYYLGVAKKSTSPQNEKILLVKGFFFAVLYHGTFNFLVLSETLFVFAVIPLVLGMWIHLRQLIKKAHHQDEILAFAPEKLGFLRVSKMILGCILIIIAVVSFLSTTYLSATGEEGFVLSNFASSSGIQSFFAAAGYFLMRKRTKNG